MKIKNFDDKIILYLIRENIDFKNMEELEQYFQKLFLKLKKIFNISFMGFYSIDLYLDNNYGAVIEIRKEELDYLEYDDNQIDMHINIHNTKMLYLVEDFLDLKNAIIYNYKNKYYVLIENYLNKNINLSEIGKVIYKTNEILVSGKKICYNSAS